MRRHYGIPLGVFVVVTALGIGIDTSFRGWEKAYNEMTIHLIYGIVAPIAFLVALFFCQLIAAPHRILKDRVAALEKGGQQEGLAQPEPQEPAERFKAMVVPLTTHQRSCRDDYGKGDNRRYDRPSGLDANLAELRMRLATFGIAVPPMPKWYSDLGPWSDYLEELREFATYGDVDEARAWAPGWLEAQQEAERAAKEAAWEKMLDEELGGEDSPTAEEPD